MSDLTVSEVEEVAPIRAPAPVNKIAFKKSGWVRANRDKIQGRLIRPALPLLPHQRSDWEQAFFSQIMSQPTRFWVE